MSPSAVRSVVAADTFDDDLNISIVGLGVQYPEFHNGTEALETLAKRHYPESNIMTKVLSISRFTGIEKRAAIGNADHPLVNKPEPPSIAELNDLFMHDGVRISVTACRKAIKDWGGQAGSITHMVSNTCTNSANPGFDHFVAKQLGLALTTEKVLLHGIGCSGGLAAIRTATQLALGASARRRPARVLVLACEISSVFVRSELESIHRDQQVRIGVCLFSDCASACIISNGIGELDGEEGLDQAQMPGNSVYDILGWHHKLIDNTPQDLGFDVDPLGWKVVLTPRVPSLTSEATPPAFRSLLASIPALHSEKGELPGASDFEWALHPGGSLILSGVQSAMGVTEQHLLASYQVYISHGNSSSATIMSVLDQSRRNAQGSKAGREHSGKVLDGRGVVAAAFGPGISLEMLMLRRGDRGFGVPKGASEVEPGVGAKQMNGSRAANGVHAANGTHATNGNTASVKNGAQHAPHTNGSATRNGHVSNGNGHSAESNGVSLEAPEVD